MEQIGFISYPPYYNRILQCLIAALIVNGSFTNVPENTKYLLTHLGLNCNAVKSALSFNHKCGLMAQLR